MDKTTKIVPESLYLCKINNYEYILSVIVHIFYNFCTNFGPKLVKNGQKSDSKKLKFSPVSRGFQRLAQLIPTHLCITKHKLSVPVVANCGQKCKTMFSEDLDFLWDLSILFTVKTIKNGTFLSFQTWKYHNILFI